jgi:hypothetical protein
MSIVALTQDSDCSVTRRNRAQAKMPQPAEQGSAGLNLDDGIEAGRHFRVRQSPFGRWHDRPMAPFLKSVKHNPVLISVYLKLRKEATSD